MGYFSREASPRLAVQHVRTILTPIFAAIVGFIHEVLKQFLVNELDFRSVRTLHLAEKKFVSLYHTAWEVKRSRHGVQIPCTPWRHL